MRHPHVTSGGRYPALRTIAVLYLAAAVGVLGLCVWQAVRVAVWGGDEATEALAGYTLTTGDRVVAVVSWLAVGFIGLLSMLAVAELIKLFIDVVHHTRAVPLGGASSAAGAPAGADRSGVDDGPAVPLVGGRKLLDGDETAEGALLRGH